MFLESIYYLDNVKLKITVIARRFLPKQSLGFQRIASLRSTRNDIRNLT